MKLGKLAVVWMCVELLSLAFLMNRASAGATRWRFRATIVPGSGFDLDSLKTTLLSFIPGVDIERIESGTEQTVVTFTRPLDHPPSEPESKYSVGSFTMTISSVGPA
jgi:hypothetical protein